MIDICVKKNRAGWGWSRGLGWFGARYRVCVGTVERKESSAFVENPYKVVDKKVEHLSLYLKWKPCQPGRAMESYMQESPRAAVKPG